MDKIENTIISECRKVFCLPDNIMIKFTNDLQRYIQEPVLPDTFGATIASKEGRNAKIGVLVLRVNSIPSMLETLCHEIVHVHQILHGRLVYSNTDPLVWFDHNLVMLNSTQYKDYPWEIEAFAWQRKYLEEFCMNSPKIFDLMRSQARGDILPTQAA